MIYKFFILFLCSQFAFGADLTSSYMRGKSLNLPSEICVLKNFKVLIIPGVLAESFISASNNQIKLNFLFEEGFKEQISTLKENGIDFEFISLETENTPLKNTPNIIKAIENSDKSVLIYSHSKGGLDTLEALRQRPDLISKIHGWASIQSPFFGAPIASQFTNDLFLNQSTELIFSWMGGDKKGLDSLSLDERKNYMNNSEINILLETINKKIKFINYASFKTNTFGIDTPLELFRNFTDSVEGQNDGVVSTKSALLKEHGFKIDFILEEEVDHLMTMTKYRLQDVNFNQNAHTISILKLLL